MKNAPLLLILMTCSLCGQTFRTPSTQASAQFYEVPFESVSRDILQNFHKKHPSQKGQRVLARVVRDKVTHYRIEFQGPDSKAVSAVETVKDVENLAVEWLDTNKDGRIDLQKHTFRGTADRDEAFEDTDFDGFFDTFVLYGVGVSEKTVHITVPKPVPAAEMDGDAAK